MKKAMVLVLTMLLLIMATTAYATEPVLIGHGYYDNGVIVPFVFTNITQGYDTDTATKTDSDQNWYVTLNGETNVSSRNILGARPRVNNSSETKAASYRLFKRKVTKEPYGYYSGVVTKGTSVFLRLKKDSESTTTEALYAAGKFCP